MAEVMPNHVFINVEITISRKEKIKQISCASSTQVQLELEMLASRGTRRKKLFRPRTNNKSNPHMATTAPFLLLICLTVSFLQLDRDGLHDLNVQGDWQKKNGTYWVRYVHVELLGHDSFGKTIKLLLRFIASSIFGTFPN